MRNKIILGFTVIFFLSCSDNPSLEFPSEKEWMEKWFAGSSSSADSSSSGLSSSSANISSSSEQKSSSSVALSSSSSTKYGSITDGNDTYKTIKIGNQTWMAENLKRRTDNSQCYEDKNECDEGKLYPYADVSSTVCPSGWHVPTDADWNTLIEEVGGISTAGTKLKATSGWKPVGNKEGNGTDEYGFAAMPYGMRDANENNKSNYIGTAGCWWIRNYIDYNSYCIYSDNDYAKGIKQRLESKLSIRCVKDN